MNTEIIFVLNSVVFVVLSKFWPTPSRSNFKLVEISQVDQAQVQTRTMEVIWAGCQNV